MAKVCEFETVKDEKFQLKEDYDLMREKMLSKFEKVK
jgi:hypothetical protein